MAQIITIPMRQSNALAYPYNTYKIIAKSIFNHLNLDFFNMYDFLTCMEMLHKKIIDNNIQFYIIVCESKYSDMHCCLTYKEVVDWQSLFTTTKTFVVSLNLHSLVIEIFDGIPDHGIDHPQ